LGVGRIIVDRAFSGLDVTVANDIDRLVAGVLAAGSGLGTSPSYGDGPWAFPAPVFGGLAGLAQSYGTFANQAVATPVASYGSTLSVAAMPLAPVPASVGPGVGYSPLLP